MTTNTGGVSAMSAEFCADKSLLPCPFCGAEAEIITLQGDTDDPSIGAQAVQCTNHACGAASGLVYPLMDDVTHLLRERWNKRQNSLLSDMPSTICARSSTG